MKAETVSTPERYQSQALAALNKAALAIGQDLELDQTLQHIVDSARELVSARYAALGVFNDERGLETFVFSGLTSEQAAEIQTYPEGRGFGRPRPDTCIGREPRRAVGRHPPWPPADDQLSGGPNSSRR